MTMTHESETALSGTHPESQMLNEAGLQAAAEAIAEYLGSDEPTSIARTAIRAYLSAIHSQGAAAPSEEPKRWMIEEHLPSGAIKWSVVEHENHARDYASQRPNPCTGAPLFFASPAVAPVAVSVKGLGEKLDRMLANWEKPERKHVMLPGTQMTCDEAAIAIRVALSSIIPATKGGEASELRRAANALINNLWVGVVSGKRSHEENWREFNRQFPGVKWLHDELAALSAQDTDGVAK